MCAILEGIYQTYFDKKPPFLSNLAEKKSETVFIHQKNIT